MTGTFAMKLIHLSDVHLTADKSDLFCGNPHDRFDRAIAHANEHHADAELCVITGDLTHWGEKPAYDHLTAALEKLIVPFQLLIGNHDNRKVFRECFPDQGADGKGFIQSATTVEAGRCIFMDTNEPGTHAGHYCADRCDWLVEQLAIAGEEPCFLFMHHPPMPVRVLAPDIIGQQDAADLRAVIEPHAAKIRHLFFGHCHLPISGSWLGIPFSSIRSLNHPLWPAYDEDKITIADTAPHYAVAFINDDAVVIHHEEFLFTGQTWPGIGTAYDDWVQEPVFAPA